MKTSPINSQEEKSRGVDKYWVPIVGKTLDLLACFESASESLTLEEIVRRTGIAHTTAFRILHTLVVRDYLAQTGRHYRLNRIRKKLSFGFANLSRQISLAVEIQASLERASAAAGIELLVWDNDRDPDRAIQNAEEMSRQKLDLAVEFQHSEQAAPIISDIFSRTRIPLVSIVNPHHGTVYFGVNNFRAGVCAGMALADHAARMWKGKVDAIVLLESPMAARTTHSRTVGVIRGLEERRGPLPKQMVHHLDGGGERGRSKAITQSFLNKLKGRNRVLIVGINDESAIGAVSAVENASDSIDAAVIGHGGSPEILRLIADRRSPCIGTVSFHAELYGPDLLNFVLPIINGKSAPVYNYVPHELIGKNDARLGKVV
jgi:ABC-type sugar transport system substrate-binding protein